MLFDLHVRKLPRVVQHAVMLCYADDTTILMRVPTGDVDRKMRAIMRNYDLKRILNFGRNGCFEFEASTISRKRDPSESSSLVMDGATTANNETLEGLGFIVDSKGTSSTHIDRVVKQTQKRLGAMRQVGR